MRSRISLSLLLVLLPSVVYAETLGGSCSLPSDQGPGSLRGAWAKLPIALVFDRDFYLQNGGRDAAALKRAAGTWNHWAHFRGKIAFVIARDGQGMEIPALTDCSQASFTASVPNFVGVWKITNAGAHANQRASCHIEPNGAPGKLMALGTQSQTNWVFQGNNIRSASALLNFDDYNSSEGKPQLDVESMMLHELGHVLGLLNSCNNGTSRQTDITTAPACFTNGEFTAPKAYGEAVMFPFLQPGELRRELRQNDYDRVNCLY